MAAHGLRRPPIGRSIMVWTTKLLDFRQAAYHSGFTKLRDAHRFGKLTIQFGTPGLPPPQWPYK